MNTQTQTLKEEIENLKSDCESKRSTPYADWQTWAKCLSQSRVDKIAVKTGFRVGDTFNPEKSAEFNRAVNEARAYKLRLKP